MRFSRYGSKRVSKDVPWKAVEFVSATIEKLNKSIVSGVSGRVELPCHVKILAPWINYGKCKKTVGKTMFSNKVNEVFNRSSQNDDGEL